MLTSHGSPLVVFNRPGFPSGNAGPYAPDYNQDRGVSAFDLGIGLLDPRQGLQLGLAPNGIGAGNPSFTAFQGGGGYMVIDQAPATKQVNNIAAAANVASGVAMTLVSSTGAGITVSTAATNVLNTGNVVPSGALIIDAADAALSTTAGATGAAGATTLTVVANGGITPGMVVANSTHSTSITAGTTVTSASLVNGLWVVGLSLPITSVTVTNGDTITFTNALPNWIVYGENRQCAVMDPRTSISRVISITDTAGAGGAFKIVGYDVWGNLQHETITQAGSSATTNGVKAWKYITSVTPQFTNAANYSVGTADIVGLPLRADSFAYLSIWMNNTAITASTGFVAAVTTTPVTATTGDVRGTYALQTAADGTKRLQVFMEVPPWLAFPGFMSNYAGLFGVPTFAA